MPLKPVTFHGDSLDRLRDFPADMRQQAGQEPYRVQIGRDPNDWKPMPSSPTPSGTASPRWTQ